MSTVLPLLLFALAGLLAGGMVAMRRQESQKAAVVLGLLAALALAGGVAWLWPGGG